MVGSMAHVNCVLISWTDNARRPILDAHCHMLDIGKILCGAQGISTLVQHGELTHTICLLFDIDCGYQADIRHAMLEMKTVMKTVMTSLLLGLQSDSLQIIQACQDALVQLAKHGLFSTCMITFLLFISPL